VIYLNGILSGSTGSKILSLGFGINFWLCSGVIDWINGWGGRKVFSLFKFSLFFIIFTWGLCSGAFERGACKLDLSERTFEEISIYWSTFAFEGVKKGIEDISDCGGWRRRGIGWVNFGGVGKTETYWTGEGWENYYTLSWTGIKFFYWIWGSWVGGNDFN